MSSGTQINLEMAQMVNKAEEKPVVKVKPKFVDSIPKRELVGKYIEYIRDGVFHTGKVEKITGNILSVKEAGRTKNVCVNPADMKIRGAYTRRKGRFLPIDWGDKKSKNKKPKRGR